jgi:hypothetical protein
MQSLPLNHKIDAEDKITAHYQSTFQSQSDIRPVMLEKGEKLWRLVSSQSGRKFSDFWMDQDTMSKLMSIFTSWSDFSETTKKNVVRDNLAILDAWKSKLSWRCQITLLQPVVGYYGQTGPQKHFSDENGISKAVEFRLGGHNQIVIPRFKTIGEADMGKWATVSHFARL